NNRDKAIANIKMGIYQSSNDILIPALQYFNQAELLYPFTEDEPEYAEINKHIGIIYSHIGDRQKAIGRILKVYRVAEKNGDKKTLGHAANNIGINYIDLGKFDKAEEYLLISLKLRESMNDRFLIGQSYNNLGTLYYEKGDYQKAFEFYSKGYELRKEFKDFGSITESEINIGRTLIKLNNKAEAEKILRRAFDAGRSANHLKFISLSSYYLKDIYFDRNEYKEAYEMQEEYRKAEDSLYGYEKRDEVNRLTIQSEFKGKIVSDSLNLLKKEKEIQTKEARNKQNSMLLGGLALILVLVLFMVYNLVRQNKREHAKNLLISSQAEKLKEQHKEIKDSINYAQNLQGSLLPSDELLKTEFKDHFVFYLPKDVVSGDFYWLEKTPKGLLVAVADCTGHGVPGAIVSVVGINALSRCVNEFKLTDPAAILDKLSMLVAESFSNNNKQLNDGMDISLLLLPEAKGESIAANFAGAHNPLWIIRNGQLIEIKATRRPVGAFIRDIKFKAEMVDLYKGDAVYMITDGYGDQFGGPNGKKLKQSKLKELILKIHSLPGDEQKRRLAAAFEEWRGDLEQIDDVTVMGFKI
ncbi:MAG: protein serine/threonine phosphatase, partial [Bacteroidetes bacterium]|nr:protein serine/threonine phosphatase [Bacteroidota bacterium]